MLVPFGDNRWINVDNVTLIEVVSGKPEDKEDSPELWGIGFRFVGGEKVALAISEDRDVALKVARDLIQAAGGLVPFRVEKAMPPSQVEPDEMPSV